MPRSRRPDKKAVITPNWGLMYNRARMDIPLRALEDGFNFRIKEGVITNRNIGWAAFGDGTWNLGAPVTLIDDFFATDQAEELIFGTTRDLFQWDPVNEVPLLLTPRLSTGTAEITSGTAVVTFAGVDVEAEGIKAGDMIHFGAADVRDIMATWHEVVTVDSPTQVTLAATVTPGHAAGPYTIRRVFLGSVITPWDTDVFVNDGVSGMDQWIATNGVDWVVSWDGVATEVTLHDEMGFRARSIASFNNMMIYGGVSGVGGSFLTSIINSDIGSPFLAGDAGIGISEQFIVMSAQDVIINLVPMGDYLIIYAGQNIAMAHFVGDPLVFIFRTLITGIGIPGLGAVADFGDFHEFIGGDTGYTFDGSTLSETNDHVWPAIIRQSDPGRKRAVYGHFDEESGELIWSIPRGDDLGDGDPFTTGPQQAFVEHYLEDTGEEDMGSPFSRRAWPFTAAGYYYREAGLAWEDIDLTWSEMVQAWGDQFFNSLFPTNLGGDIDGNIWTVGQGQTAGAGGLMSTYVRFGRRVLGTGRERALLQRIYPYFRDGVGNVNINTYMYNSGAQNIGSAGSSLPFDTTNTASRQFVSPFKRGRWTTIELEAPAGVAFDFEGYDIDAVDGGLR